MRLLVLEFITGGGLNQQALSESLAHEGLLMLRALLDDLSRMADIQLLVPYDQRLEGEIRGPSDDSVRWFEIIQEDDFDSSFQHLIQQVDAVWIIAPETGDQLSKLCAWVQNSGKRLIGSSVEVIALCSDKLKTIQHLTSHDIACANTYPLSTIPLDCPFPRVVKPYDGVGCEDTQLIPDQKAFGHWLQTLDNPQGYIVQPYLEGIAISISAIFKQGKAWPVCVNLQRMAIQAQQFSLMACVVNDQPLTMECQQLIAEIAAAIPGLWGYAGVDMIITDQGLRVLEINPRLTTSYAGIRTALGINLAEQILRLTDAEPDLHPNLNQSTTILL